MLPILQSLLVQVAQPVCILSDNIRWLLVPMEIVGALPLGPEGAMPHVRRRRRLISHHHTLYQDFYPDVVKPKWHRLLHILENMSYGGRLLCCSAAERKHRSVMTVALHVCRRYEHTVAPDLVNPQTQSIPDDKLLS